MPKKISQREAMKQMFLQLCAQYQQMGEQLKVMSTLIGPYLNNDQELTPILEFEVGEKEKQRPLITMLPCPTCKMVNGNAPCCIQHREAIIANDVVTSGNDRPSRHRN